MTDTFSTGRLMSLRPAKTSDHFARGAQKKMVLRARGSSSKQLGRSVWLGLRRTVREEVGEQTWGLRGRSSREGQLVCLPIAFDHSRNEGRTGRVVHELRELASSHWTRWVSVRVLGEGGEQEIAGVRREGQRRWEVSRGTVGGEDERSATRQAALLKE